MLSYHHQYCVWGVSKSGVLGDTLVLFTSILFPKFMSNGCGCSSVGTASDRHATEAGSIPRCGKGSLRINFQCRLFCRLRTPPCVTRCINIYANVKDPVVRVRVRWIMEPLKHPPCTVGWVARLCRAMGFPMGGILIATIQLWKKISIYLVDQFLRRKCVTSVLLLANARGRYFVFSV